MKKLLLTTDDFGMCHAVNAGIVEAMTRGMAASTNFLAPAPWFHEAVALVERVQASAERHAKLALDAVAMTVPGRILGVALRQCPGLPPTVAERIKDYRAQNVADWVMYRKALAAAAEARGWAVHWFDAKKVFEAASEALQIEDLDSHFLELRRSLGSPWGKDHKIAMAAAIVAARVREK